MPARKGKGCREGDGTCTGSTVRKGRFPASSDGQDTLLNGRSPKTLPAEFQPTEEDGKFLWSLVAKGLGDLTPEQVRDDLEIRRLLMDVADSCPNEEIAALARRKLGGR